MDIRSSLDGLRSLLGVNTPTPAASQSKSVVSAQGNGLDSDQASVSSAASEVSQAAAGDGVRADKVAAIQSALAQGTYNVPASAVASKLVESMLGAEN
jgi:flagellar biosynthesis anti-sigma factor FlgM